MIQDIAPHRLGNQFLPGKKPDWDSIIFCFTEDGLLLHRGRGAAAPLPEEQILKGDRRAPARDVPEGIRLPQLSELLLPEEQELLYLFSMDDRSCFLLPEAPGRIPEGFEFLPVRQLREEKIGSRAWVFASITAEQLARWYRKNRFCGCCGAEMERVQEERALRCTVCGNLVYPKIVPAVIVGVLDPEKEKLLLTQYAKGFRHYALVAGFTEIGESLEETVAREVQEETGLRVKNIRYYKSQPWGVADDILAGFYCDVDGSPEIRLDRTELKLAVWKGREEILLQPDDFSLTNEMMLRFKEGKPC